jgi:hypothetical protein
MELAGGLTRSVPRGLGRIEPTGDVLVAYAAKAGTIAEDGPGTHSPFAEALLAHLATPGLDIRLVMGRVRDAVLEKTARAQEPFMYGSLGGSNVTLVPGGTTDSAPGGAEANAARDYELAAKVGTKEAWDAFLARHPTGFYADLARAQRAKLVASASPSPSTAFASPNSRPEATEEPEIAAIPKTPESKKAPDRQDLARLVACCLAYCRAVDCNSPPASIGCTPNFLESSTKRYFNGDTRANMRNYYDYVGAKAYNGSIISACR